MSKMKQQPIKLKYKILMVFLSLCNIALLSIVGAIAHQYLAPGLFY